MREISVNTIVENVRRMCIDSNCILNDDIYKSIREAKNKETNETGIDILSQLLQNADIAKKDMTPICQDTGMAVVFVEIGQDVRVTGGSIKDAVNEGVRLGYREGYLRKSIVNDPLLRVNTNDNTPSVIHFDITEGDGLKITVAPKGFGSENMSRLFMLSPSEGVSGVKKCVMDTVKNAGPNPCPPIVAGVGIGGNFELSAILAKKALLRPVGQHSLNPHIKELEADLLEQINATDIGPQGLGGKTTALWLGIETFATHIAGLPVAVNISCHVTRHAEAIL